MGFRLVLFLVVILKFGNSVASVAVPEFEIQAFFDIAELTDSINSLKGTKYQGYSTLCSGGAISLRIDDVQLKISNWFREQDGQYGSLYEIELNTHIKFDSSKSCSVSENVICRAAINVVGLIRNNDAARAQCIIPKYEGQVLEFVLFEPPELLQSGVSVDIDKCDTSKRDYSCAFFAQQTSSGEYERTKKNRRNIQFSVRNHGASKSAAVKKNSAEQPYIESDYLIYNVHAGSRHNLLRKFDYAVDAKKYIGIRRPLNRSEDNIGLSLELDVFNNVVSPEGAVIDKGVFDQLLPLAVSGRDDIALFGHIQYDFVLDDFKVTTGELHEKPVIYVELNSFDLKVHRINDDGLGRRLKVLNKIRIRVVLDPPSIAENGIVRFSMRESDIKINGLFGTLSFSLNTTPITKLVKTLIAEIPLAKISQKFEFGLPRCVLMNDAAETSDLCDAPNSLKHVSGIRGYEVEVNASAFTYNEEIGRFYLGGKIQYRPLSAN